MRQYEFEDCLEDAVQGEAYEIIKFSSSRGCINSCTLVNGFGNDETRKVVWVPYGSEIELEGIHYKVIKGRLSEGRGRRDVQDQSTGCLEDLQGGLYSLYEFIGKKAVVSELAQNARSVSELD